MDALERLRPVSDRYASLPVEEAFNWVDVLDDMPAAEWYMVAFRSVRKPEADEKLLDMYDEWAHREAESAPGYAHYFKGPMGVDGACLSFCFWSSRAEARAAAAMPSHARAAAITRETYASYTLEFHRVRRLAEEPILEFQLYDAAEPIRTIVRPTGDTPGAAMPAPGLHTLNLGPAGA
jgi:hypothetical protein